jgi:hypothetical protein
MLITGTSLMAAVRGIKGQGHADLADPYSSLNALWNESAPSFT